MILTVNCGSSSVRLDLFDRALTRLGSHRAGGSDAATPLAAFLAEMPRAARVEIVAHRVVHGGERLARTVRIDAEVERALEGLIHLAPLHNAPALAGLRAARRLLGDGVEHFAVLDTAFFASLPAAARTYALPASLAAPGLRRFGFHGLAHRAMWERLAELHPALGPSGRAITFQLGAGCSVAAIRGGVAVDTSMGFTPLEGLVMATRPGDLDPGLVTHLQRVHGLDPDQLDALLYRESGLLGLAGEASAGKLAGRDDEAARLAIDVYCHRARRHLGASLAVLGGADAIAFGGGVGENVWRIRARICEGLEWAGVRLDAAANRAPGTDGRITASDSKVDVHVVAVDEAAVMGREALLAMD